MSAANRQVEKLELPAKESFEEQGWVLQIALFVLAAYTAGLIIAFFSFNAELPQQNAFIWLFALGLVYGLFAWIIQNTSNRRVRRGMLLAFLLSLMVNLSIGLVLAFSNLITLAQSTLVESEKTQEVEKVVEFDFSSLRGDDRQERENQKPVEAGQPDFDSVEPLKKQAVVATQSDRAEENANVENADIKPSPTIRQERVETAPRFADMQGTISRQSSQAVPKVAKPTLQNNPAPQRIETAQLTPRPAEVQREQSRIAPTPVDNEEELTTHRIADQSIARKEEELGPPKIASAEPTLPRQVRSPIALPNAAAADASREASTEATPDETPDLASTNLDRTPTQSPERRMTTEPIVETPIRVERSPMNRQQPAKETPQLATNDDTPLDRAEIQNALTSQARVNDQVEPDAQRQEEQSALRPSEAEIAKQETNADSQRQKDDSAEAEPTIRPTESTVARKELNTRPSRVAEQSPQTERMAVASTRAAPTPATARVSEQAIAHAADNSKEATEMTASSIAVSKSLQGVSGARSEPNFESETPAKPSLVDRSSASAKRVTESQQSEPGPAIAPSSVAEIKRAKSEAETPAASMFARQVEGAATAGSEQVDELDASTSSTVVQAESNAPRENTTAQKGTAEVDFGPTMIAASTGRERASGGGQPEVNLGQSGTQLPRSFAAKSSESLDATRIANVAEAPNASAEESEEPLSPSEEILAHDSSSTGAPGDSSLTKMNDTEVDPGKTSVAESSNGRPSRAQATETRIEDVATLGGGTESPLRAPRGRMIKMDTRAKTLAIQSREKSGGEDGLPLAAEMSDPDRAASGVPQANPSEYVGALADDRIFDGKSTGPSTASIERNASSPAIEPGPTIADEAGTGLALDRARVTRLPSGVMSPSHVDVPLAGTEARENDRRSDNQIAIASEIGKLSKSDDGGLMIEIDAAEGVGGLFADSSTSIGLNRRRAVAESDSVTESSARFIRKDFGAPPAINPKANTTAKAFQNRMNRKGDELVGGVDRPSPKTEQAIELGLVFLSKQQLNDGSWSLNYRGNGRPYPRTERAIIRSDAAATGLSLLAFLGAGYHHRDDKYQQAVHDGLAFLLEKQQEDGNLYIPQDKNSNRSAALYSHGIATIALCEAYGMTQDPWLKEPAQRALNYIAESQNPTRGGWRYTPGVSSDTSVSGWMMMAIRSGELANLKVAEETHDRIRGWLSRAQVSDAQPHLFRYNPYAPDTVRQRHGRAVTKTMTSVGLLMRLYTGWQRDRREMIAGADYLMKNLPAVGSANSPQRDTYYWYYATQVMFHMGGKYWEAWNARLHPLLAESQVTTGRNTGSWNPTYPIADRWAPHGGRLYITTLNLLSLEVYYRHLPIYEDTAK